MEYVINGDPIPLARARHGNGRTWDPQKQLKLHWGLMLANQHRDMPLLSGPLEMQIVFFMPKPKTSIKKMMEMQGKPHYCKPDLDNLIKWVGDCCNGIIYKDDASISWISSRKIYDNKPRTQIKITTITPQRQKQLDAMAQEWETKYPTSQPYGHALGNCSCVSRTGETYDNC